MSDLSKDLRDEGYRVEYIAGAAREGKEALTIALRDVVRVALASQESTNGLDEQLASSGGGAASIAATPASGVEPNQRPTYDDGYRDALNAVCANITIEDFASRTNPEHKRNAIRIFGFALKGKNQRTAAKTIQRGERLKAKIRELANLPVVAQESTPGTQPPTSGLLKEYEQELAQAAVIRWLKRPMDGREEPAHIALLIIRAALQKFGERAYAEGQAVAHPPSEKLREDVIEAA